MIRTLFAMPVLAFFCAIMFVMYLICIGRLFMSGKLQLAFGLVNSLFSEVICCFYDDLNDWCSGKEFGDRLDNLMGD